MSSISSPAAGYLMGFVKTHGLGLVLGFLSFFGGYQVRGYQVQQHEARIAALEVGAPSGREWQELNNRLARMELAQIRIEQKVDHLAEVKADKR